MTPQAWAFMTVVWTLVLVCTGWSFYKLLTSKRDLGGPS